ncbi:hypothetical protein BD779DRAFT_1545449 [Infundibulicybe gibba]|nr:hypothetical protein BD779DRAFT_1545449 [Infundibulicybe gibba]
MSSDYDYSDEDGDYYDDEDMIDGTQEDGSIQSESDVDMDAFPDDFKVAPKGKRKSYEIEYESLSQSAVEKLMQEDIDHICGIFGVDANTATLLLRSLSWNKEKLIERYMDDQTPMLVSAGIIAPENPAPPTRSQSIPPTGASATRRATRGASKLLGLATGSKPKPSPTSPSASFTAPKSTRAQPSEPFVCPICFDDSKGLQPLALEGCGHGFCAGCWGAYLGSKINDEGEHAVRCMAETCALIAPDTFVRGVLLPEPAPADPEEALQGAATWARFQELLVRHFVASNPNLKYCPYPSCTNTVSCPSAASRASLTSVVPTWGTGQGSLGVAGKEHKFCFGCPIESDHRPVICGVARMWLKKCRDDSETANWIKSNTKECSMFLLGVHGYVACSIVEFVLTHASVGPWSEHGTAWYSCNRYDEKGGIDARDAQSKSRASLERYLHYYNRWANHEQSAKLSLDLYAKTEKKMEDMQITSSLTWIEVQFMKKAVEEVDKCRMTLKWTYAMAYYLAKGNEKDLFEDNQRDLERAVEDLSELLESQIEPENIPTLRQMVTDKTVYVQKRNEIVLEDTAAGFLDGRWRWNVAVDGFDDPERID